MSQEMIQIWANRQPAKGKISPLHLTEALDDNVMEKLRVPEWRGFLVPTAEYPDVTVGYACHISKGMRIYS